MRCGGVQPGDQILGDVVDVVAGGVDLGQLVGALDQHGRHAERGRRNQVARQVLEHAGERRRHVVRAQERLVGRRVGLGHVVRRDDVEDRLETMRDGFRGLDAALSTGADQVDRLADYRYPVVRFSGLLPEIGRQRAPLLPAPSGGR